MPILCRGKDTGCERLVCFCQRFILLHFDFILARWDDDPFMSVKKTKLAVNYEVNDLLFKRQS